MEERLYKIFANVNDWLKFAEAKNLGILTLNAAIVFGLTQIEFEKDNIIEKAAFYVYMPFAIVSFLVAFISLLPIINSIQRGKRVKKLIRNFEELFGAKPIVNIHYYGHVHNLSLPAFISELKRKTNYTSHFNEFEKDLASQIIYNSSITWLKFQLFKMSSYISIAGMITSTFSLPVIKFLQAKPTITIICH
jgi:hypothetical protein